MCGSFKLSIAHSIYIECGVVYFVQIGIIIICMQSGIVRTKMYFININRIIFIAFTFILIYVFIHSNEWFLLL